MSLIKKTLVLTDSIPKGYATFIRVGNESGIKIVGESFTSFMKAYIKIGTLSQTINLLGKKTETELDIALENADNISCVIFSNDKIVAIGGKELSNREKSNLLKKDEPTVAIVSTVQKTESDDTTPFSSDNTSQATESQSTILEPTEVDTPKAETTEPESIEIETNKNLSTESETIESQSNAEVNPTPSIQPEEKIEQEKIIKENEFLSRLGTEKKDYYLGISDKVDELFVVYPTERLLQNAIPDSEWVKINYDGNDYYVVGRLKENEKVRYLGYGVPGKASVKPPKIADGIANWFPLSGLNGYDGYWLFFQDADTGKIE